MIKRSRRNLVLAAAAALAVLTAGCGGSGGGSESDADTTDADATGVEADVRDAFPDSILDSGVLRVGFAAPQPPLQFVDDNQYSGIDYELFTAVTTMAGLELEITNLSFESLMPSLQAGRIDVTGVLLPSADRRTIADFVIYFKVPYGILLSAENPLGVEGVSDLCGHSVALVEGSTPPQMIVEDRQEKCSAADEPPIETTFYTEDSSAQLAVKSGQHDAYIQSEALTSYIAKTVDDGEAFTSVPDLDGLGGTVYFADAYGVLKDDQELITALQNALQKLVDNGEYAKILDKYGVAHDAVKKISINEFSEEDR